MADFDLIAFINSNLPTIVPSVINVASAFISAMFLRRKTGIESGTQEFEKLKAGRMSEAAEMLLNSGKITYVEFSKMKNYIDIAKKADELCSEITDEIPQQDLDWHMRFYDDSGYVSDETMQETWAKVLAGEIYHPGAYSRRTLTCLKNLSKEEALLFKKTCAASIRIGNNVLLPRFGGIMEKNGITYDDVLKLDDCGLIKSDIGMTLGMSVGPEFGILTSNNQFVLLVKENPNTVNKRKRLDLPEYTYTACGRELYSVVNDKEPDIPQLYECLKTEFQDCEFVCGNVIKKEGNTTTYANITIKVEQE